MVRTTGGHYVIPVEDVAQEYLDEENLEDEDGIVDGTEADEVMQVLFEAGETEDEYEKLHEELGHTIFTTFAISREEEKEILKVHKYFGHRSARKIWELFSKANKLKGKRKAVIDIINRCKACSKFKKSPPRPRV